MRFAVFFRGVVLSAVIGGSASLGLATPESDDAALQRDWRMQDGIGTPREPVSYAVAVQRTVDRGQRLVGDLRASGVPLDALLAQWDALRARADRLAAEKSASESQWESLWREVHQCRRRLLLAHPLADFGPLAFVKQVPSVFSHQLTQYYGACARPGGGVCVLQQPGQSPSVRELSAGRFEPGSFQHLDVSFDGRRLLFSYCHAPTTPVNREQHPERFYRLYEMSADGAQLRQLTDAAADDFAPRYLPDGKIMFVSTRRGGFHRCGRGPCPVYTLAIANGDGSQPRVVSFHETNEWDPAVMNDGRVTYTRWDYVDRNAVHYQNLWSVRPDGSDVRIFYGNHTLNPIGVWEPRAVPGSHRVMATAAAHHAMTAGSIILLDPRRGVDGPQPITRLTPDAPFPESEMPVPQTAPGTPADPKQPVRAWHDTAGLTEKFVLPEEARRWPGHCYRSPYPLSETLFLAAYSFESLVGEPVANLPNMFGLYLVDSHGNKELLYRDPAISSLWPMPLRARPLAPVLPEIVDEGKRNEGTFVLQNVYASWLDLPKTPVKRLRIVQVLPKSTPHANTPTLGLANASPGKQVLGTVPVESDGSACFTAPAGVPLSFQALDEQGRAVQTMRSLTYLQPGEAISCVGCHESRSVTASAAGQPLAMRRPPSKIRPGPSGSNPLSYPLLVQPVLDRKCVSCHNPAKPDGKVILTGTPQGRYSVSYNAMAPLVPYSSWGGKPGDFRVVNSEPATRPGFFGARGSKLMQELLAGHFEVALDADEIERLVTWMDANALFYGTFDPDDQSRQQRGQQIAGPKIQ